MYCIISATCHCESFGQTTSFHPTTHHKKIQEISLDTTIITPQTIERILITDITGKTIYENTHLHTHQLKLTSLCIKNGLYFIKAFDANGNIVIQEMIKKE